MIRKAIQQNPTTLCVSLPAKWVKQESIKRGDELFVDVQDNKLMVSKEDTADIFQSIEIDCTQPNVFDKNMISGLYQTGYDEIKVKYSGTDVLDKIKTRIQEECIGFDILEQDTNSCIIRSISAEFDIDFNEMFKKNMQVMVDMISKMVETVEKGQIAKLKNIRQLEKLQNKFQGFCLRYISKNRFPQNPKRTSEAYVFIRETENICDCLKRICDEMTTNKIKIGNKILQYMKKVEKLIIALYNMYYNIDNESRNFINRDGKKIYQEGYNLIRKTSGNEGVVLHNLIEVVSRVYYTTFIHYEMIH